MTTELSYITFITAAGWVGLLRSAAGLLRSTLPLDSAEDAYHALGMEAGEAALASHRFEDMARRLELYFAGKRVAFADGLDLFGATGFQRRVWGITRLIPYGETRSYAWVVRRVGQPKALRAAGQALARNPLPVIIPCHRVIASGGGLGGYSGGIGMKRALLDLEAKGVSSP